MIELPLFQLTGRLSGVLSGIVLPIVRLHLKKKKKKKKKKKGVVSIWSMFVFLTMLTLYPDGRLTGFALDTKTSGAAKVY